MKEKFGIRATGNLMIGKGTFIKAPGYKHSIETKDNTQIGDGTFIDTTEESEKSENNDGKSSGGDDVSKRLIDFVFLPVCATLMAAAILRAITYQFAH